VRAVDHPADVRALLASARSRLSIWWMTPSATTFPRQPDASGQDAILAGRIRQDVNDRAGRSVGSSAMTINS
jgi:hypothetical protein